MDDGPLTSSKAPALRVGEPIKTPRPGTQRRQMDRERADLLELMRADDGVPDDYHPLVELAKLANTQNIPLNLRMKAHSEIAQYTTPKLRAEDPPTNDDDDTGPTLNLRLRTE